MATDPNLVTESAESATTQAVVGKSTPTLTASSGTQEEGSVRHLDRDEDWDEMSSLSERECLMSSHSSGSQLGSTASQKLKARSSDSEQVCREEDEGVPTKRAKSMDKHNENERIRRKGLRESVLKLREVLHKKTRKPAVNCVLTAAYSEIQELKRIEEEQEGTLNQLRQRNFLLEYTLNRLKTERGEELSGGRSVPVVSNSSSWSGGSHPPCLSVHEEPEVEPVQSHSSTPSPAEPIPASRSRDPPPLLDATTRMLFPPILSPPIPPSPLPMSPATPFPLMRTRLQIPFPFSSPLPVMGPYFYSHRPSFPPPPLVYLPPNCPPMVVGSPAFYPSRPQNYESPPMVGQVSRMEATLSPDHKEIVHFTLSSSTEQAEQTQAHRKRIGGEDNRHRLKKDGGMNRTVGVYAEGSCSPLQQTAHSRRTLQFGDGHANKQGSKDFCPYHSTRQTDKQHFSPNHGGRASYSHLSPSSYGTSILIN